MDSERYRCCASCKNFLALKEDGKVVTKCARLGYVTKPFYKFNCWDANENILLKIKGLKKEP